MSLNLDADGNGAGIIAVGGIASVDAVDVDGREDGPFWAKCKADAEGIGLTEAFAAYSTRLKIAVDKVWTQTHRIFGAFFVHSSQVEGARFAHR